MSAIIPLDDIVETAYEFQAHRDDILKSGCKLPIAAEWYTNEARKAEGGITQDETYFLTLSRYVLTDGTTSDWIAYAWKTNIHARAVDFGEVIVSGQQVLELIYNIYKTGGNICDGAIDVFGKDE